MKPPLAAPDANTTDGDIVTPGLNFDGLPRMPLTQLRRLWKEHIGLRTPQPRQKGVLIRELVWRVQERLYGGLDAQTKELLRAAMRGAAATLAAQAAARAKLAAGPGPVAPPTSTSPGSPTSVPTSNTTGGARARHAPKPRLGPLPESSRLIRTWRGRTYEVEVLDAGKRFLYREQEFESLSEVARLITGVRWSGPRFFGLVTRPRSGRGTQT